MQQRVMDVLYCKQSIEGLLAFANGKKSAEVFQAEKAANLTSDPQNEPRRTLFRITHIYTHNDNSHIILKPLKHTSEMQLHTQLKCTHLLC